MQTTKNPGKQRKKLFNAPAHIRHKLMAAPLSPELLAQKGVKALPVRKGDTIRIMRGDHKGFEGKVSRVDLKRYRVYLEGLTREKVDGTTVFVALHPSKVMIKNLNLDDKVRKAVLDRKKPIIKKGAKVKKATKKAIAETKPAEEAQASETSTTDEAAKETSKEGGT
jgi:large subunit ribosomal protein L24